MITFSGIFGLSVGDDTTAVDDAEDAATVDDVTVAGASATAGATALAGIIDGRVISRLCGSVVIVAAGLIGVWLTAVTLVTVCTAGSV